MIELMDRLTLSDGNVYEVVGMAKRGDREYFHLLDTKFDGNMKFCYLDGDEMVEFDDKDLTTKLLPDFYKSAVEALDNPEALKYLKELIERQKNC